MNKEKKNNLMNSITKALLLLLILYFIYNIGRSIYNNYQVNKTIEQKEFEIVQQEEKNFQLINQNLYFQTDTYKEIEARRKLGLKMSGEKVVVSPDNLSQTSTQTYITNQKEDSSENDENIKMNYQKWWEYIIK